MILTSELRDAISDQINKEFTAAYSYLGMSAYFEHEDLPGFAHWFFMQYQEELAHAHRLFQYLLSREGGEVSLKKIEAPRSDYSSVLEVFETALKQEQANTASISELYQKASVAKDYATVSHLQWFLDEQVEEEKTAGEALSMVKLAGDDPRARLYLNDKFGSRPAGKE